MLDLQYVTFVPRRFPIVKLEMVQEIRYVFDGKTYQWRNVLKQHKCRWDLGHKQWYTDDEDIAVTVCQITNYDVRYHEENVQIVVDTPLTDLRKTL